MFFNSVCFTIYAKKTIISKKTKYLSAFKQFIHQLDEQYFAEIHQLDEQYFAEIGF